ncbi:hypothetical protein SAMN05216436_11430 [bacterium A37T11]|nr:hypothetical protein SAMN05216436_11430 [bacterium A37T11]
MPKRWVLEIVVAFVFLYLVITGGAKLFDFKQFGFDMNAQPVAEWIKPCLKYSIPFIQIILAFLLEIDKTRLAALVGSTVLIASYIVYILAINHDFFPFQPCSCTWINKHLAYTHTLHLNVIAISWTAYGLLIVLIAGLIKRRKHRKTQKLHSFNIHKEELVS